MGIIFKKPPPPPFSNGRPPKKNQIKIEKDKEVINSPTYF